MLPLLVRVNQGAMATEQERKNERGNEKKTTGNEENSTKKKKKNKKKSDFLLLIPTHGQICVGRSAKTNIHQLCENSGFPLHDLGQ